MVIMCCHVESVTFCLQLIEPKSCLSHPISAAYQFFSGISKYNIAGLYLTLFSWDVYGLGSTSYKVNHSLIKLRVLQAKLKVDRRPSTLWNTGKWRFFVCFFNCNKIINFQVQFALFCGWGDVSSVFFPSLGPLIHGPHSPPTPTLHHHVASLSIDCYSHTDCSTELFNYIPPSPCGPLFSTLYWSLAICYPDPLYKSQPASSVHYSFYC